MNLPPQFTKEARARVEAERIRASRSLNEARRQEPPPEWKKGKRAWDQCSFYAFVLRVFGAFAHETCELGRQRAWTVDRIRCAATDFLDSFAFDQYYEQGHDRFGEKFPDITNHWTGTLSLEVERSLQQSGVWRLFEDELLAVAEKQSGPVVGGSRQAPEALLSAGPDIEGSHAGSILDRGRQAEGAPSVSPTQIANPYPSPDVSPTRIASLADATLESELISYWRQFRSDPVMWERGNQEEKESRLAFPPCLVAYDIVPIFVRWALRVSPAENTPEAVAELITRICPDEEYAEWAESGDGAEEREARFERHESGVRLRGDAEPRLFGAWERAVQSMWDKTKGLMGKYESCPACREYDSHHKLSPATRALRLLGESQPVQDDLKRQLQAAIAERDYAVSRELPGTGRLPSESEAVSATHKQLNPAKRRGRRPNLERRDAIRGAMGRHGDGWRNHLSEIFLELDDGNVDLGDFGATEVHLGDGQTTKVLKWEDLDLTEGNERTRIIDVLRKYVDQRN
jgi:hypothetical protein